MKKVILSVLIFISLSVSAQRGLKPGFDKAEYTEMLRMASAFAEDSFSIAASIEPPISFVHKYRSPVMGLENRWDLWISGDTVAAISIRGSVPKALSWTANYYAGMVAAEGKMVLGDTVVYKLTDNSMASVHAGWLIGTLYLSKDILPKIDSCYKAGIRNFFVTGHSQGGAICFLTTALLRQKQADGLLPADICFKSYSSAAPKPGNTVFAYEYEAMTAGGWAFNVVNPIDWVPETPLSVQTIDDFPANNPFTDAKKMIKAKKMPDRLKYSVLYAQLTKPTYKSERRLKRYLGSTVGKMVENQVAGFRQPDYAETACYMRTGVTVVLKPDAVYYGLFPRVSDDKFLHHMFNAYKFLIDKY